MKKIEIIVAPNGGTRVETTGFVGAECREASRFLEQALGQRQTERLTNDFYVTESEQQRLQEGQ